MRNVIGAVVVGLLLIGCGALSGAPAVKPGPADASAVLEVFKARGLPIGETTMYTAESDPNHLLGRPGSYTSKVAWRDTRITDSAETGVGAGGSVEFFPDAAGARQRGEYVSKIAASSPLFTEYTMAQGRIVLRLSKVLTPEQVEQYRAVLSEIPG